ncbi:MAG: hypothetical protein JKY01_10355 [Pseudomonadales bacterium]|nr:hypothetical protein [Pseudomonadales bacterium]
MSSYATDTAAFNTSPFFFDFIVRIANATAFAGMLRTGDTKLNDSQIAGLRKEGVRERGGQALCFAERGGQALRFACIIAFL